MAGNSNLFKPNVSGSGIGQKKTENGQFINPPAYPDVSGFSGPGKVSERAIGVLQKTPSAKSGKV